MHKWGEPIRKDVLEELYVRRGLSVHEIAAELGLLDHKVRYWMDHYGIKRRHWRDAMYLKHNPGGEKFRVDCTDRELFVAGVTLYWVRERKRTMA